MREAIGVDRQQPALYPWLTWEDLQRFKVELLAELKVLLETKQQEGAKRWLKSYEVRRLLNMSAGTLQTYRMNGTLPFTKMGGTLYYEYRAIENLLQKQKVVRKIWK
ncbi:MAG: DNA-binding protein [Candidatus Pseudobacter hemicellulosilyticus]|uniref:DNA-binding protein n=1 Tax=Candidatus Pseudobacter hemicellulosilyticus TaxID=3121375 RepID=A0AAJ5WWE4_9BACT|nr:MAG: DNA-binding protein [Pseudobacter sp.]